MKKYIDETRLWDYPTDATRQAIIDLLDLQFKVLYYKETLV